jgi:type VI secretion system protein ImpM
MSEGTVIDTDAPRLGFFGKVSTRGDFVCRRIAPTFRSTLDKWLSASITASKRQMGDGWLPAYLKAPLWRFMLGPGIAGRDAAIGVMMPSVDRVGRYFPLILAAEMPDCERPGRLFRQAGPWFEAAEGLLLSSLEDDFNMEAFDKRALALAPPPYDHGSTKAGNGIACIALDEGADLASAYAQFVDELVGADNASFSMWWTVGSDNVKASLLVSRGLPAPTDFAAMLDGQWRDWGLHVVPAEAKPEELTIVVVGPTRQMPASALTHPGTRRKTNEDAFLSQPDLGLWAVADGVGGHQAGATASKTVVDSLGRLLPPLSFGGAIGDIKELLQEANAALCVHADRLGDDAIVASTVVVLLVHGDRYAVLWSGDSRAYLIRENVMVGLTRDHAESDGSSQITQAIGAAGTLQTDMVHGTVTPGDRFLLCSDGLTKSLHEGDILSTARSGSVEQAVTALIQNALVSGALDNVTALLVEVPHAAA